MDVFSVYVVASLVTGLCVGSFLNVCIYRIPEGQSIISPSSSCPSCGHKIRWFENIPVLSYLALRGKCSSCGGRISLRYPLVELIAGIAFLLLFLRDGPGIQFAIHAFLVSALIIISFIDLRFKIIPDVISLPGIVLGLAFSFLPGEPDWLDSLLGMLAGGGILFAVAWGYFLMAGREGMGGGDIKLLAMIGAFLGWQSIPFIIFASAFLGAVIGIIVMAITRNDMKYAIPFGPFLSIAAFAYIIVGKEAVAWYQGALGLY